MTGQLIFIAIACAVLLYLIARLLARHDEQPPKKPPATTEYKTGIKEQPRE